MKLKLWRSDITAKRIIGELLLDGQRLCWTLEDPHHEVKVPGETCIPAGTYKVELTFSPRFQKIMPLLVGVPGFEGVRIHTGNSTAETAGCVLVGLNRRGADWISMSRQAWDELMARLQGLPRDEEIWLEIIE